MRKIAVLISTAAVGVVLVMPAGAKIAPYATSDLPEAHATTASRCPAGMALVGDSCVDKWEASLVEVKADGSEKSFSPYERPEGKHVRAVSRPGVVPQAYISMTEAKSACKASGKRLCRATEWKTACKGPEHTRYPYGNTHVAGACVDTNRVSPIYKLHGGQRDGRTMNDPRLNQVKGTLEATGASAACTNGYGVYDMVGNVHEWVDDGSFRGGYYLDTQQNNEGCDYLTTAHATWYHDYSIGFRCCADPVSAHGGAEQKLDRTHQPEAEVLEL